MKKSTLLFLTITVTLLSIITACSNEKNPLEGENAKLHQEIIPMGKKSDLDTIHTLTEGQYDSIALGK